MQSLKFVFGASRFGFKFVRLDFSCLFEPLGLFECCCGFLLDTDTDTDIDIGFGQAQGVAV
jgi:hypothetical protein